MARHPDPYDNDELAGLLARHISQQARSYMPEPVLMQVTDTANRLTNGYVLAKIEDRQVRVMVPGNVAAESGYVLVAYPPSDPSSPYWAFGSWAT